MNAKLPFKPFDEQGKVRIYQHGFLPHWRQDGCTYFVTFRLADSIPLKVFEQWKDERFRWLDARGIDPREENWKQGYAKLPAIDRTSFERRYVSKFYETLNNAHGACILRNPTFSKLVSKSLYYFHNARAMCGDAVVMPNHVHALMTPLDGFELEDTLRSIKSYTAHELNRLRGETGKVWMNESYDRIVRDGQELVRIQAYIRRNPEKANLGPDEYVLQKAEYEINW